MRSMYSYSEEVGGVQHVLVQMHWNAARHPLLQVVLSMGECKISCRWTGRLAKTGLWMSVLYNTM